MPPKPDFFHSTTYSDDCASFFYNGQNVGPDEYDTWGKWWPLLVDGVHVADFLITYGDGWETHLRTVGGHKIQIDFIDNPEHESDCNCHECDPQE